MGDLGKITITKNKDCDNKTYYSAYIYGIDAVIGGGDTRNEAKDELFGNIVLYVNYLIETNQKLKQKLEEKDKEIESLKQQLAEAEEYIENDEVTKREYYQKTDEIIAEKDKEIERLKDFINCKKQFAIQELEKVLMFVPFIFVGIIYILNPNYFDPLFASTLGYFVLFVIFVMVVIYIWFLQKIMKVKV